MRDRLSDQPAAPEDVPASGRGQTRIADRVVAKVAAQAAREALRTGPGKDTLPRGPDPAPGSGVDVRDWTARVRVSLALGYPSDIGAQCGAVRQHVAVRVRELTGMDVPDVAVRVERLQSGHLEGGGQGRVQ